VEVLDDFANYFYHLEEWRIVWSKLSPLQRKTALVIQAAGASPGSTANLLAAATMLGNAECDRLDVFARLVDRWHKSIHDRYARELRVSPLARVLERAATRVFASGTPGADRGAQEWPGSS
jgi:hypothetical protein